jgi:D-methionine transport system substrate-binding protein
VVPNEALNNGDIDANAFQHVPYLNESPNREDIN